MIKEGEIFPNNKITLVSAEGNNEIETDKVLSKKKVILFGIPGAFRQHVITTTFLHLLINFLN